MPGEQQAESTEKVGVWPPLSFPQVPGVLVTTDLGLTKPPEKRPLGFRRRLCAPGKGFLPRPGAWAFEGTGPGCPPQPSGCVVFSGTFPRPGPQRLFEITDLNHTHPS